MQLPSILLCAVWFVLIILAADCDLGTHRKRKDVVVYSALGICFLLGVWRFSLIYHRFPQDSPGLMFILAWMFFTVILVGGELIGAAPELLAALSPIGVIDALNRLTRPKP